MSDYSIKDDYNKKCSQVEKKEWGTNPSTVILAHFT